MDDLNLSMFRAYDIRTPSEYLTDDLAARLARAEAAYFRDTLDVEGVLVAHDARMAGPRYLEIAAREFLDAGLKVVRIDEVCSSSMFYFAAMKHPRLAAVLYGASHNPANDTGQKLLAPGVRPIARNVGPEGGLDRIQELFESDATPPDGLEQGTLESYDPLEEYLRYSMDLAGVENGSLEGIPILHDYLNGAAGREMVAAFEFAGANLVPLHSNPDGDFPLGDPNPVKDEVIREGLDELGASDFLFGAFFDGDGDRIDVYRGDGRYLSSSFVYAGILPALRERFREGGLGVYADLKSNPLALMEMAKAGFSTRIMRNGHSQIKEALYDNPGMIGAVEESAHFYEAFRMDGARYCTENTLYFALLIARAWSNDPDRFAALFDLQETAHREREWGHKFPTDSGRAEALAATEAYVLQEGGAAITRTPEGYDLEGTIIRRGLPFEVDADTKFGPDWIQVCQRVSESEDGLARWEVVAANEATAAHAKQSILDIVARYGASEIYRG